MLSVLSIGITHYNYRNIPCTKNDAQKVYDTFQKIMEEDFSKYTSVCIYDTTVEEVRSFLISYENFLNKSDIFVFYFSGHGEIKFYSLDLCLGDADTNYSRWNLNVMELLSILGRFHCQVILILDCCYSGTSINMSYIDQIYGNSNITILTSSSEYRQSSYDESGSVYTRELCNAFIKLYNHQEDISIDKISKIMKDSLEDFCGQFRLGGRTANVILKKFMQDRRGIKDFCDEFVRRLERLNFDTREVLWYSLMDFPDSYKLKILDHYFKNDKISSEPHWIVRRAIGSVISSIKDRDEIKEFLKFLCLSESWMIRCVGFNGSKYDQNNDIVEILKKNREKDYACMDVSWLANLYYFDKKYILDENIFSTDLMKSAWGIIDLWKRVPDNLFQKEKLKKFKEYIENEDDLDQLERYLYYIQNNSGEDLLSYIFRSKIRGRLPQNTNNKWILSILKGKWRDQSNLNLENYLKNHNDVGKSLIDLKDIEFAELKMGVLDFFCKNPVYAEEYKKYLKWALNDNHPWVVRSALPIFKDNIDLLNQIDIMKYDRNIYPGVFDLILEMAKYGVDVISLHWKDSLELTKQERESLEWAVQMEK